MSAGKKSSFILLQLTIMALAAGQNVPVITNVIETSSAQITDFSVNVGGGAIDFFLIIENTGNLNISVFPEITVYDSSITQSWYCMVVPPIFRYSNLRIMI